MAEELLKQDYQVWVVDPEGEYRFRTASREIPHVRHLHKYLDVSLPEEKRFYFKDRRGNVVDTAGCLWDFRQAIQTISIESLEYHLYRGDFSSWLREVLHDEVLARLVEKTASYEKKGESLRQALFSAVVSRYDELERLT